MKVPLGGPDWPGAPSHGPRRSGLVLEIELAAGTYHFGFLVDGEWFVPEATRGQVSDDWGQMNATIVVP